MKDDVKPLPCPWCQQSPSGNNFRGNMQSGLTRMFCEHCGAEGPSGSDKENALHWWNHRASRRPAEDGPVAQLEVRDGIAGLKHLLAPIDQVCDGMMLYRSPPLEPFERLEQELRCKAVEWKGIPAPKVRVAANCYIKCADRLAETIKNVREKK